MRKAVWYLVVLLGATLTAEIKARVVATNDDPLKQLQISIANEKRDNVKSMELLDADQWRELLEQGRVREIVNRIQRALGSKSPVRVRTQWGGPDTRPEDLGNVVRNTINWGAYTGDRSRLNLVMDSKLSHDNGKVKVIDPSIGVNFQLKYDD